jgi:hypothetical protein
MATSLVMMSDCLNAAKSKAGFPLGAAKDPEMMCAERQTAENTLEYMIMYSGVE